MTTEPKTLDRHVRRPRSRFARWIKRGLLAAAALAAIAAMVWGWMPRPVLVAVATARVGPLEVTVEEDGRTRVRARYVVSAPIGGMLERIDLDPGTAVERGAVVARIGAPDPVLLDPRTRDQATAALAATSARDA